MPATNKGGGAKTYIYKNIKFKSGLEVSCYKALEGSGLTFQYEPIKAHIWEGFKPEKIEFIAPQRIKNSKGKLINGKILEEKKGKIQDITYTPDFIVTTDAAIAYFDVKGNVNDVYPYKRKMFLKQLEENAEKYKQETKRQHIYFFEPHSLFQMLQAIKQLKDEKV